MELAKSIGCHRFINADLITAGLSLLAPERNIATASRLFVNEINNAITAKDDFAFETTLAGRGHLRRIKQLRQDGWQVELIYLALLSAQASRDRVAERVAHGGHNIPLDVIFRRFPRSLYNLLHVYLNEVDNASCILSIWPVPCLIFEQSYGHAQIYDKHLSNLLLAEAHP